MKNSLGLLRIGLLVLLITSCIVVVSASAKSTNSCGTVYVGQMNLDISGCIPSGTTIGWWVLKSEISVMPPTVSSKIEDSTSFNADPSVFTGYTGYWYIVNPSTGFGTTDKAIKVMEKKVKWLKLLIEVFQKKRSLLRSVGRSDRCGYILTPCPQ